MCGIAGVFSPLTGSAAARERMVQAMTDAITRRGPDGQGHVFDHAAGLALGHRRLAVVDLTQTGAQPMTSHSGRMVMVYNGEMYNTDALRRFLDAQGGYNWRGTSDTEVLLELIERLGLQAALDRVDGMFALAVFDRDKLELTLARDTFGEKPLYYGDCGGQFAFASQLNALRCVDGFAPEMDPAAIGYFFKHSYIPAPLSIFKGIEKLKPGHFVTVSMQGDHAVAAPQVPYWDAVVAARTATQAGFTGGYDAARDEVARLLESSVSGRMVSDVPLGSLLSGGIDSSLVTALMARTSGSKVKTFCIGMAQNGFDESDHARQVAAHLGTDHTELILNPQDVLDVVPTLPEIYDEPFSDSSQIPTYLVAKLARESVTVALSGDAGDEVLGGYNRYIHGPKLWAKLRRIPAPLRHLASGALNAIPMGALDKAVQMMGAMSGAELASGRASEKVKKLSGLLGCGSEQAFHDRLLSTAQNTDRVLNPDLDLPPLSQIEGADLTGFSFMQRLMLNDTVTYLPGDILAKVDRASMFASLETRTPFLNRPLFDFAWSLPDDMKVHGGVGKRILRDILYTHVPRDLVDRPKAGFALPIGPWLRTELRDWAEDALSEDALGETGVLNVAEVRARWEAHVSGRRNHDSFLWSVLMFQGWHRATIG